MKVRGLGVVEGRTDVRGWRVVSVSFCDGVEPDAALARSVCARDAAHASPPTADALRHLHAGTSSTTSLPHHRTGVAEVAVVN
jgi:hypothetical protein